MHAYSVAQSSAMQMVRASMTNFKRYPALAQALLNLVPNALSNKHGIS